jgi:NTE family protein
MPNALESVTGAFEIMQSAVLAERMKHSRPDLYLCPELRDVRMLDFGSIEDVLAQAAPAALSLKQAFQGHAPALKKRITPVQLTDTK